jgi:ABC-type branched-subunit amino acid transport system permease subunit
VPEKAARRSYSGYPPASGEKHAGRLAINAAQAMNRELLGLDLSEPFYFYYAALPFVLAGLLIAWRVTRSPFGRVLVSIRTNPARARALGYRVDRYKLLAFVLPAALSGLAGACAPPATASPRSRGSTGPPPGRS